MFDPYIMLLHTILIIRTFVHIILFTLFRIQIVNGVSLKFDFLYGSVALVTVATCRNVSQRLTTSHNENNQTYCGCLFSNFLLMFINIKTDSC